MRRGIAVIALVMMFASGSSLFGSSLTRREPTAGADLIAYQLTLGSTMKRDGDAAELFANDRTGAAAFESRAAETIRKYLRKHGTEKDSLETKAKVYFSASFYGHRIEASSCKDVYVFYLTASGTEHTPTEEFEETWEWSSLNSQNAADLETSLIHELELALQDFLAERPVVPDKESLDKPSAQPKASSGRKPHNARFRRARRPGPPVGVL
ncbi:MAG TPA: hypothetical protein VGG20_28965 [Thermoanaerobaculia bacterium]